MADACLTHCRATGAGMFEYVMAGADLSQVAAALVFIVPLAAAWTLLFFAPVFCNLNMTLLAPHPLLTDPLDVFTEKQRERSWSMWMLIITLSMTTGGLRSLFWPGSLLYFLFHFPLLASGLTSYAMWRNRMWSRTSAARFYFIMAIPIVIAGAWFGGPHALEIFSYIYSIPTLLLFVIVLECGLGFAFICLALNFLALLCFTNNWMMSEVTYVCVECLREEARFGQLGAAILILGAYIHLKMNSLDLLKQSARFRDFVLAVSSHELKTPCNGIVGSVQLLRASSTALNPAQNSAIQTVERCVAILELLVGNILSYTQEKSLLVEEPVRIHFIPFLEQAASILRTIGPDTQVQLDVDAQMPEHVVLPKRPLMQILLNLGSNAIKFGDGVVKIVVDLVKDSALIQIIDDGCGVAESFQDHLFEPYARDKTATVVEGSGLGLYITQKLAKSMGGSVGYRPNQGKGSTFWVCLPLGGVESAVLNPSWNMPDPICNTDVAGVAQTKEISILVCEDNAVNGKVMISLLEKLKPHARVTLAKDGAESLQRLIDMAREPRDAKLLCFVDVNMPFLTGPEVVRIWKEIDRTSRATRRYRLDVTFVAVTASAMVESECFDAVLPKPLGLTRLGAFFRDKSI